MSVLISGDTYSISFPLPAGAPFGEIALYAELEATVLGPGTRVIGAVTGFGTIVNMSAFETTISGAGTEVGNVWANGDIRVSGGAHVAGFARTPEEVILQTGGSVDDLQDDSAFDAGVPFTLVVEFEADDPPDETAGTGTLVALPPGSYGVVTVEDDADLELTSGIYHFDELTVSGLGSVRVRANSGPVDLRVRNVLEFNGSLDMVAGNASQFRIVYVGSDDLSFTAPFFATVIAPRVTVMLNPGGEDTDEFVGAFFASGIATMAGAVVRQQAFFATPTPLVARYFYGFSGPVGAGPYERELPVARELSQLESGGGALPELWEAKEDENHEPTDALTVDDSRTYTLAIETGANDGERIQSVVFQAAEGQRPFIVVSGDGSNAANLTPATRASSTQARRVQIDGIWFGTSDDSGATKSRDFVIAPSSPASTLLDDWDEIFIKNSTFDPGGLRADRTRIAALRINVTGKVTKLVIERSILGPIEVTGDGIVQELVLTDCIVDATQLDPDANGRRVAIRSGNGVVRLTGVTVFGDIEADILEATNTLVTGQLVVADTQASCFRFSAASAGPEPEPGETKRERLPRLFRSTIAADGIQPFFFNSQRFGDPGYAQLAELTPDFVVTGAENGSEIGVFSFLLNPVRLASILAKVNEFKPIGVLDQYILEGEDRAP